MIEHARYLIEAVGPELRQYSVAGNKDERPFNRDQRRWMYASAKLENNYFGFGTDERVEHTPGYVVIKHRTFGRAVPASYPRADEQAWDDERSSRFDDQFILSLDQTHEVSLE